MDAADAKKKKYWKDLRESKKQPISEIDNAQKTKVVMAKKKKEDEIQMKNFEMKERSKEQSDKKEMINQQTTAIVSSTSSKNIEQAPFEIPSEVDGMLSLSVMGFME